MGSTRACEVLAEYAAAEHADENIRFWIAVQAFKRSAVQLAEAKGNAGTVGTSGDATLAELEDTILSETQLEDEGSKVIDTFLCADSPSLVNLPSSMLAEFTKPSSSGVYTYSATMFDVVAGEIFRLIQNDTFARFRYSDEAEKLLWDLPMVGVTREGFTKAFTGQRSQEILRPMLREAKELTGADRVTAWLVDNTRMWSISSTTMGNALLEIPYGKGVAGKAASTAQDVIVDDAYQDPRFNVEVDKATGYKTRTILCVPLVRRQHAEGGSPKRGGLGDSGAATVVLQLLNKIGEDKKHKPFTPQDAQAVRDKLEVPFIDACDLIALTAGRRGSFVEAMHANAESLRASSG